MQQMIGNYIIIIETHSSYWNVFLHVTYLLTGEENYEQKYY